MRTKDWKYIRCWDPGIYERTEAELYDVIADPAEQHDVSAEHPDVAATMEAFMDGWLDARHAGGADPMDEVITFGLPAVRRLEGVIQEDSDEAARARPIANVHTIEPAIDPAGEPAEEADTVPMTQAVR